MMSIDEAIERLNLENGMVGAILVFPNKYTVKQSFTEAELQRLADGDALKNPQDGQAYRAGNCSIQKNGYLKIKMARTWIR